MRSLSLGKSGLWSDESGTARQPKEVFFPRTARESPTFAHSRKLPLTSRVMAVLPEKLVSMLVFLTKSWLSARKAVVNAVRIVCARAIDTGISTLCFKDLGRARSIYKGR